MKKSTLYLIAAILSFLLIGVLFINSIQAPVPSHKNEVSRIVFVHWREFPNEIFEKFEKEFPNIKVDYEKYSREEYSQILQTKILAHEKVDVMGVPENDYDQYIQNGYLKDLSNRVYISRYAVDARKPLKRGDAEYAVAYEKTYYGIWYNKAIFKQYGLGEPHNFSGLLSICGKLKSNGVTPLIMGSSDDESAIDLLHLRAFQMINTKPPYSQAFATNQLLRMLDDTKEMTDKEYIHTDPVQMTAQQAFKDFANGKAAMTLAPDTYTGILLNEGISAADFGVFPIPYQDTASPAALVNYKECLIGINTQTDSSDASESFMEYMSRPETVKLYSDKYHTFTTIRLVEDPPELVLWQPLKSLPTLEMHTGEIKDADKRELARLLRSLFIAGTDYNTIKVQIEAILKNYTGNI